jgi:hypothetical protein
MAKNWEKMEFTTDKNGKISLVPVKEKVDVTKKAKKLNLRHVKKLSYDELKKEGDNLYLKKVNAEDHLVDAYNEKRVKSQVAIKQAKSIIAKREKEAAIAAEKAAKKARRDKLVDTNTAIA